ncbi:TetR/AcrR family transcriptional regulator [Stappia sp. F7233]|uniref:TetR/AcrR family transcriptional regulator n=1 Tax=Stappia albiluteola TaxID=2758565 RepID=A0A839AHW7_9HYPH|nr:TetR/AcrR family transcriptional regulator [Stappia albiluteola]MBA5778524.1 TetR/AcrR family transcriptional regulator [Stappia albiluteola]
MGTTQFAGKASEILDVAEARMRAGGFDAVSFRDIAADVGIKSASVHYHFPQKVDLGEAVIKRYRERFAERLGAPDDPDESVRRRIERLCGGYRQSTVKEGKVCLACVLGGEALNLPAPLSQSVGSYFDWLLEWTDRALRTSATAAPAIPASVVIGSLQGSMILAVATHDPDVFLETERWILASL